MESTSKAILDLTSFLKDMSLKYFKDPTEKSLEKVEDLKIVTTFAPTSNKTSASSIKEKSSNCMHYISHSTFNGLGLEWFSIRPKVLNVMLRLGYYKVSRIQETCFGMLLTDKLTTCVIQGQSGTGKTFAYVAAMLTKADSEKNYPQILCIEPTADLVHQTYELCKVFAMDCQEISIQYFINDDNFFNSECSTAQILIAEAGEKLTRYIEKNFFELGKLKAIIFDEADLLIQCPIFRKQIVDILNEVDKKCQRYYFSATFDQACEKFIKDLSTDYCSDTLSPTEMYLDNIDHYYIKCTTTAKIKAIKTIYSALNKGIVFIFTNLKTTVEELAILLKLDGLNIFYVKEDNDIVDRTFVYNQLIQTEKGGLISTDLWSRGINVNPKIVIHFSMPNGPNFKINNERYLHRSGRTGRFGEQGVSISLVDNKDDEEFLKQIEIFHNIDIKETPLEKTVIEDILKETNSKCKIVATTIDNGES